MLVFLQYVSYPALCELLAKSESIVVYPTMQCASYLTFHWSCDKGIKIKISHKVRGFLFFFFNSRQYTVYVLYNIPPSGY